MIALEIKNKKIGFVITGSFCMFKKTIPKIKQLIQREAEVIPIMSFNAYNIDTKYENAKDVIQEIEQITNKKIIHTIKDAEYLGNKKMVDIMIIAPCTR